MGSGVVNVGARERTGADENRAEDEIDRAKLASCDDDEVIPALNICCLGVRRRKLRKTIDVHKFTSVEV